ncbi:hypothetical protein IC615_04600 [Serratia ureilytica]
MDIKDTKKIVILVDAYSSGNDVAPEFNKKDTGARTFKVEKISRRSC